jgi:hypothetical protein
MPSETKTKSSIVRGNKINSMFIRIPYYDAKKINILTRIKLEIIGQKICQWCFHFNSPGKRPVWAFAITWCLSSVCLLTFHTSNFFLRNTEQETKLAVNIPIISRTSFVFLVGIFGHGQFATCALSSLLSSDEWCKAVLKRMMVKMHFP